MKKIVLKINARKLLHWYFDTDDKAQILMDKFIDDLKREGIFTVSLEYMLDYAGYIPASLIVNKEDMLKEDKVTGEVQERDEYEYELV